MNLNPISSLQERNILSWLNRVLQEKTQELKEIAEQISVLNHQQKYFKTMREEVQIEIIEGLLKDLERYEWRDSIIQVNQVLSTLEGKEQ